MNDTPTNPAFFLGTPGEPVTEVEPDELKTIWHRMRELQARYAGEQHGLRAASVGLDATTAGKPDARSGAIWLRTIMISVLHRVALEQMAAWMKDEEVSDGVFRTMAKIPMQWIGHTPPEGLPFDVEEFFRLLREGGVPNGRFWGGWSDILPDPGTYCRHSPRTEPNVPYRTYEDIAMRYIYFLGLPNDSNRNEALWNPGPLIRLHGSSIRMQIDS